MTICLIKKRLKNMPYRDLIEMLSEMPEICKILGLKEIPHYTTIQKFFQRFDEKEFLLLIEVYTTNIVAVDGTGFHSYSSKHYEFVIKRKKPYQKMAIGIDTEKQKIQSVYTCHGHSHDTNSFVPLLKPLLTKTVVADKGFDSIKNREFAKSIGIKPVIPYKEFDELLALMNKHINKVYHRRSLVETVFSVIKRKFGDYTYSRNYANLRKEMFLTAVTYNIYAETRYRLMGFSTKLSKGFLKSI
jgi:IS5 family transposase